MAWDMRYISPDIRRCLDHGRYPPTCRSGISGRFSLIPDCFGQCFCVSGYMTPDLSLSMSLHLHCLTLQDDLEPWERALDVPSNRTSVSPQTKHHEDRGSPTANLGTCALFGNSAHCGIRACDHGKKISTGCDKELLYIVFARREVHRPSKL